MFFENTLFMDLKTKKRAYENYLLKQFSISKNIEICFLNLKTS